MRHDGIPLSGSSVAYCVEPRQSGVDRLVMVPCESLQLSRRSQTGFIVELHESVSQACGNVRHGVVLDTIEHSAV
eukprot:4011119-Alexandrium_andersonii.AAC.1